MPNEQAKAKATNPPKEFVDLVKDALEHLYDFPYLEGHTLARNLATKRSTELPGKHLREKLLVAIESLSPQSGVPFRSPQARIYNLIRLRYVEGMTVQETAHELRLSLRQTYRDLRRAEESIAAVLWVQQTDVDARQSPGAVALSSFETELEHLKVRTQLTGMHSLIREAQKVVERLALQRGIDFNIEVPTQSVTVSADPVVARQILVNLFSHTVQQAQAGTVKLVLTADNTQTTLTLRYRPETKTTDQSAASLAGKLAERLGWEIRHEEQESVQVVTLQISVRGPTILVIDDNQGLVDLLNHFLIGHACRVVAATSGQEGLQLAQQFMPDAVVLDIMMPEMDGWEVLQRLRGYRTLAETPIIICSVFNDPELAYSLGASLFISKPINREKVLTALQQVGILE
jgi:CheY-like chemotaxis protein